MVNWFTWVPLAKSLVKEPCKQTVVRTLRANKREIPSELQNERIRRTGIAMFCNDNGLSYKSRVIFLPSWSEKEETVNYVPKSPGYLQPNKEWYW